MACQPETMYIVQACIRWLKLGKTIKYNIMYTHIADCYKIQ